MKKRLYLLLSLLIILSMSSCLLFDDYVYGRETYGHIFWVDNSTVVYKAGFVTYMEHGPTFMGEDGYLSREKTLYEIWTCNISTEKQDNIYAETEYDRLEDVSSIITILGYNNDRILISDSDTVKSINISTGIFETYLPCKIADISNDGNYLVTTKRDSFVILCDLKTLEETILDTLIMTRSLAFIAYNWENNDYIVVTEKLNNYDNGFNIFYHKESMDTTYVIEKTSLLGRYNISVVEYALFTECSDYNEVEISFWGSDEALGETGDFVFRFPIEDYTQGTVIHNLIGTRSPDGHTYAYTTDYHICIYLTDEQGNAIDTIKLVQPSNLF